MTAILFCVGCWILLNVTVVFLLLTRPERPEGEQHAPRLVAVPGGR